MNEVGSDSILRRNGKPGCRFKGAEGVGVHGEESSLEWENSWDKPAKVLFSFLFFPALYL